MNSVDTNTPNVAPDNKYSFFNIDYDFDGVMDLLSVNTYPKNGKMHIGAAVVVTGKQSIIDLGESTANADPSAPELKIPGAYASHGEEGSHFNIYLNENTGDYKIDYVNCTQIEDPAFLGRCQQNPPSTPFYDPPVEIFNTQH